MTYLPASVNSTNFPFFCFCDDSKWYMSLLKGCHIAWKVHSVTVNNWNISCVTINVSNEQCSASSSSVRTNQVNEQMCSPYKLRKAKQYITWKTNFFADEIIVKLPGKVLPGGVCTGWLLKLCQMFFPQKIWHWSGTGLATIL
jgi:hypothetical protein